MQVVDRTRFAPGFAGHIDRGTKILSGWRNAPGKPAHMRLRRVGMRPFEPELATESAYGDARSDSVLRPEASIKR